MDIPKTQIVASLLLDSRIYQALPIKARVSFLSKLSAIYPSFFQIQGYDGDEETAVGYEAAWAGIAKQEK